MSPLVDIREARRILLLAAREEREAADLAFEERNEGGRAWYSACLSDFSERSGAATAYRRAARLIRQLDSRYVSPADVDPIEWQRALATIRVGIADLPELGEDEDRVRALVLSHLRQALDRNEP